MRSASLLRLSCAALFACAIFAPGWNAQELPSAQSTARPKPAPAAATAQNPPQYTVATNVELVNMVFSVQDKKGAFVPGLAQSDFKLTEDGRPQKIEFFSVENDLPLTVGLLLDTSPSQERVLEEEQQVSEAFFRQVMGPKDLAFVIGLDVDVTLLQDLTASQAALDRAISGAHIGGGSAAGSVIVNPGPFPSTQAGATHLWDSIYLACTQELAHQPGRKAIIVVTDGGEQGSKVTDSDALRAALDSNTIVYTVLVSDPRFQGAFGTEPPTKIEHISDASGGRAIRPRGRDLQAAFDQIQNELRTQYTLGYRSDRPQRDGTFRSVKIDLDKKEFEGAKVRSRTGYYATKDPAN